MENETHHEHTTHHHQEKFSTPASIIVGAILISASILYGNKLLIKEFGSGGVNQKLQAAGQNAAPLQPAAPSEPTGPVDVAERKDAAVLGKSNAKVTVMVFTDFQCPFCQRFFTDAYKQIKEKYVDSGKAKIVYRHFPLAFHQNAQKAGEAAECANRQGKFVEYHDVLFQKMQADGTGLDVASLKTYAADLRLSTSKFNSCLDNGETAEIVKGDMAAGQAAGVSGTPTIFVNGNRIVGAQPFSSFESVIEQELNK